MGDSDEGRIVDNGPAYEARGEHPMHHRRDRVDVGVVFEYFGIGGLFVVIGDYRFFENGGNSGVDDVCFVA